MTGKRGCPLPEMKPNALKKINLRVNSLEADSHSEEAEDEKSKTAGQTYKKRMCSLCRILARSITPAFLHCCYLTLLPCHQSVTCVTHTQPLCLWFARTCHCQCSTVAREEAVHGTNISQTMKQANRYAFTSDDGNSTSVQSDFSFWYL